MFSLSYWNRLAHSRLHGFVGFVFGAFIVSAPLIYISTSTLIIRNKKPLITIPLPKIPKFWETKKVETPAPEKTETEETKQDNTSELDENIPPEIRAAFIRAKNHPLNITIEQSESDTIEDNVTADDTTLPLPPDFDITFDSEKTTDSIPTFTDFLFDTDQDTTNNTSDITEYLNNKNIEFETIDDIIVTKTHAIATHDDSDFWVTDNENWFATGKTKPSPILAVKTIAEQHNVTPVLYLAETNIMDIETLIPQWESDDIIVITDINKLQ